MRAGPLDWRASGGVLQRLVISAQPHCLEQFGQSTGPALAWLPAQFGAGASAVEQRHRERQVEPSRLARLQT